MSEFNSSYEKNLPDYYAKNKDSNNYKLLEINRLAINDLRSDITAVFDTLDMDKAHGGVLDMYGEMLKQPRGKATDTQYRYMLRARIERNLSSGDYESIVNAMTKTFRCKPEEFILQESAEPCTVDLVRLPFSVLMDAGFTTKQTVAIIQANMPAGVKMNTFVFEGTFEFGGEEYEYDAINGLAAVEGDSGGYFGVVYGEDDEIELPI